MFSRHFFRSKVFQSLYAFALSDDSDVLAYEKSLLKGINHLYDLYIYQLSLIPEIIDLASQQAEEAKLKYFPSEEEKNPNLKFLQNSVAGRLTENRDLKKKSERLKINWGEERHILKTIFNTFKEKPVYTRFMTSETCTFDEEKQLMASLFKYAINYPALEEQFMSRNLYWEDDYYQIAQLAYNTLRNMEESFEEYTPIPEFFEKREDEKGEDEKQFTLNLFRKTIMNDSELSEMIKQRISTWEYDRIAVIDIILIKMAISELLYFPSIPVKVSINEYVELTKEYSSEKSKTFVNAILDRIVIDLKNEGLLKKSGRGLITE